MALSVVLVGGGLAHAVATGSITVGASFGEVAALGANQLLQLRLPFVPKVFLDTTGFESQFYVLFKSLDGNVTGAAPDAVPFAYDTTSPIVRLRVDIVAAPASSLIWLEAHHSIGR